MPDNKDYLGDGVYASYDGYQIRLAANSPSSDKEVFLEPAVLMAFIEYAIRVGAISIPKRVTP